MRHSIATPRAAGILVLLGIAALLSGCETDGSTPGPLASLSATTGKKDEPPKVAAPDPITHTQAAEECWMATEKGHAGASLDQRADIVDKCIAEKMKTAEAPPKR